MAKIICVGRNYRDHAVELNNAMPQTPVIFMKPFSCAVPLNDRIVIPNNLGAVHHEAEIYFTVCKPIARLQTFVLHDVIATVGVALDLTLRDLQNTLKTQGLPWEKAKCFDASCPISEAVNFDSADLSTLEIKLFKNNILVQGDYFKNTIFSLQELLTDITQYFSLNTGDIILTGTPAGVGPLQHNDALTIQLFARNKLLLEKSGIVTTA